MQILSDLHLEVPNAYDVFHIEPKAPYLALVGDIGYAKDDGFFRFLRKQLEEFRIVFLVLGNHEPYYSSWTEAKTKIKRFESGLAPLPSGKPLGQFVFLDKARHDISSTLSILGCTLFSQVAHEQEDSVSFGLNDNYYIDDWSVEAHQEAHRADLDWLNNEIDSISRFEPNRKVVVLTHYCPLISKDVVDPQHAGSKISSAFMSDLSSEPCWNRGVVKLWAFGHTHFNCDFRDSVDGKRVISNQRGYYFSQAANFDGTKIVDI
ncbi:hypothetical protein N7532_005299 [Penicillium argentinense]|uniref:Calcineurin-like phosphoesterase domain-containing protein n=1 Tax=Penicillium argentinense TaxID=1131581 RepID=A0A9W9FDM3_9EURO|nr:uncharacterized protein N7532_005299 [Penicillium argentinense]KAJ5098298.1 hypothetical protein N7532_005299 [Penicillium argentinense]